MVEIAKDTFSKILYEGLQKGLYPGKTRQSITWFRNRAKEYSIAPRKLMYELADEGRRTTRKFELGKMYMFFYSAKHKATLPYYDRFPVIFPIEAYKDGFLGINFHYLPHAYRAKLMDSLYGVATSKNLDANTKLKVSYNLLNSAARFKYFKPTVKRYLSNYMKSDFIPINANEWDVALFLPVSSFTKSESLVWADSIKKINS